MATFSMDNLNQALFDYWKTDISLVGADGKSISATQYNKHSTTYLEINIFDRSWSSSTIGSSSTFPDLFEIIVSENKVVEIRKGQPAADMPLNGYAIVTRGANASHLEKAFKAGDKISLDIKTNPDWNRISMAVTGSAILLKDGKVPDKFSMDSPGRHPRTVVGSTQDGNQLLLVTIDGRHNSSLGMTLTEAARLMLQLGAYNALNLDGGGSTTMVTRTPGANDLQVVNRPSEGIQRRIASAIGIFSIAPPSELDGLYIDTTDKNVFVNTSRNLTIRGFDKYHNPVDLSNANIQWRVSGVEGTFQNNTFYPTSSGKALITASVGNATGELEIKCLDKPVQLILNNRSIQLDAGRSSVFTVHGIDSDGYRALINPSDISWTVNEALGSISNGVFTAKTGGTGHIQASFGDIHAYCGIIVPVVTTRIADDFERINATFTSHPLTVKGSYQLSNEEKRSGSSSGKLTYDFELSNATRAAYVSLSNEGIALGQNDSRVGVWAFNPSITPNWLRAEITDSAGKKHFLDLRRNLDWNGWQYVDTSLSGISMPARLTKIYVVQVNPVASSGYIYLDDITVTSVSTPSLDLSEIPLNTPFNDKANIDIPYRKEDTSFRFTVFGAKSAPRNILERYLGNTFADITNKYIDAAVIVGEGNHNNLLNRIKTPSITTASPGFRSQDIATSRFIQLDMGNKSLRSLINGQPSGQWPWLLTQLNSFMGDNIFIFLSGSPKNFTDPLEHKLLHSVLSQYRENTGRNVWVFFKGPSDSSLVEDGVRYISTQGLDTPGLNPDNAESVKFAVVTVNGANVYFRFRSVI